MPGKDAVMPAADFIAWLDWMDLSDRQATAALGLGSRNTLARFKVEGAPLYIALACAALDRNVPPWAPGDPRSIPRVHVVGPGEK